MGPTLLSPQRDIERALRRRQNVDVEVELKNLGGPYLRASSLGSCGRKLYYLGRGLTPQEHSYEGLIQMVQGDWGEDGMADLLREAGYRIKDSQRELTLKHEGQEILKGHIDGLISIDSGIAEWDDWSLWEMKMMSAFRYKKLVRASVEEECPTYYDQIQMYMWLLNEEPEGEAVGETLFMAMAKDPSAANMGNKGPRLDPLYIEAVPFDYDYAEALVERAIRLHQAIEDGEEWEHERDPYKDWDCSSRFCPVYDACDPKVTRRKP